jgi:hypothetical protein
MSRRHSSNRRANGNDRRSLLVQSNTTGLVPIRQRIKTDRIHSGSQPWTPAPSRTADARHSRSVINLTGKTKSPCRAAFGIGLSIPGGPSHGAHILSLT